ncbi:MAG: hypothetical protein COB14_07345 [Alphaproteobacteria bacterium]|nr:MAG: hypothetical protein COB14_07345 [Alphaproteobacteria bacterium]
MDNVDVQIKTIIEEAGDMSDVSRLPMGHPPFVSTLSAYASRFLYDALRDELGDDVVSNAYDPGNKKHDPYGLFDNLNEFAQLAAVGNKNDGIGRKNLDSSVKTVVTAFCKTAQCSELADKDALLQEASNIC